MSTFIADILARTDLSPAMRDIFEELAALPLADDRGREVLARLALAYNPRQDPERPTAAEFAQRILETTRAQFRRGDHVACPGRATRRASDFQVWREVWSAEADSVLVRGAAVSLDWGLGVIRPCAVSLDYPGDVWHWLLEPGEVAPRTSEARYLLSENWRVFSDLPRTAWATRDEVKLWPHRQLTPVLDLTASMAQAQRRSTAR